MKRILLVVGLVTFTVAATFAFFSDTEVSKNNVFATGMIDLLVDNTSYYNGVLNQDTTWDLRNLTVEKFFNFLDLKPGDWGEDTISFHVNDNEAWLCADIKVTENSDNGINEPEDLVDGVYDENDGTPDGDLARELKFAFWADDGDNVYEDTESIILQGLATDIFDANLTLADSTLNRFGLDQGRGVLPGETYYMAKIWCYGELDLSPVPDDDDTGPDSRSSGVSCNGAPVSNLSQTDLLTADLIFRAVQHRNNPDFTCDDCQVVEVTWATSVADYDQGLRKDGNLVNPDRSDPNAATNEAELTNLPGTFFSLGFGGYITLKFDYPVLDLEGDDLSFHEVTNLPYPEETAGVYVSQNGIEFEYLGEVTNAGAALQYFDISGTSYQWIQYVKVVDTTDPNIHNNEADGYDLDGLNAENYNICIGQTE